MRRLIRLAEQWLPLLACMSGAVVPIGPLVGDGAALDRTPVSGLDTQMREILDFVALQERRSWSQWQRTGSSTRHTDKPRPS